MIHHLALTASDLVRSVEFYDAVLGRLGYRRTALSDRLAVWEGPEPEILLYAAKPGQRGAAHRTYDPGLHHIAFMADTRSAVRDVFHAATGAGGRVLDEPRAYPEYAATYFAAFFEDPDGIKLEVMTLSAD